MPDTFTSAEYADIVFCYGFCNGNALAARAEYHLRFPQRRLPADKVFSSTFARLRETGSTGLRLRGGGPFAALQNEPRTQAIIDHFDENPSTSTRRAGLELGIPRNIVHQTLKADGRHAYHLRKVQHLLPEDFPRRRDFCTWFLQQTQIDPNFPRKVLWTDETTFTRHGIFNQHNSHIWSHENPHAVHKHNFQHQFSVNVWMGVLDSRIIGPFFLPPRLNGQHFLEFLNTSILDFLENLPLNQRAELWWQMDGCPAHIFLPVRGWLDTEFPNKWMGRFGPTAWPARSPDMTVMDFFLFGIMKSKVYATPVENEVMLRERIVQAVAEITPVQIRKATQSVVKRCQECLQSNGGHFEQLHKHTRRN